MQGEGKQRARLEEEGGRASGCLCWITTRRVLNARPLRLSKVIKPERENTARESWQHTLKTIKDFVSSDTAILLPRIYSKEIIKGVSRDADRSCDHNSKNKKTKPKKTLTCPGLLATHGDCPVQLWALPLSCPAGEEYG